MVCDGSGAVGEFSGFGPRHRSAAHLGSLEVAKALRVLPGFVTPLGYVASVQGGRGSDGVGDDV